MSWRDGRIPIELEKGANRTLEDVTLATDDPDILQYIWVGAWSGC